MAYARYYTPRRSYKPKRSYAPKRTYAPRRASAPINVYVNSQPQRASGRSVSSAGKGRGPPRSNGGRAGGSTRPSNSGYNSRGRYSASGGVAPWRARQLIKRAYYRGKARYDERIRKSGGMQTPPEPSVHPLAQRAFDNWGPMNERGERVFKVPRLDDAVVDDERGGVDMLAALAAMDE